MNFGKLVNFKDSTNAEFFAIKSPRHSLQGPYAVLYKNEPERWTVVAILWQDKPRLGIRWFWENLGHPISRMYPTWFVIPELLEPGILNSLSLSRETKKLVMEFLAVDDFKESKDNLENYVKKLEKVKPKYIPAKNEQKD